MDIIILWVQLSAFNAIGNHIQTVFLNYTLLFLKMTFSI